jgi:hypothetical protein
VADPVLRAKFSALDDSEARTLYRLTRNPRLWSFMVLAGEVGLEGAIASCEARALPEMVCEAFARMHYYAEALPSGSEARKLVLAARVLPRWTDKRNRPGKRAPLVEVARDLGATLAEAERALAVARKYGWVEGDAWQPLPTL